MEIRDAVTEDAEAACEVMRRSITELCEADHRSDPKILASWLANKQPAIFKSWLSQLGNWLMVAVEAGDILGVGSVTDGGEITLNYVSPDAPFVASAEPCSARLLPPRRHAASTSPMATSRPVCRATISALNRAFRCRSS
jgi:hypothetical protein